ncbi:protein of unknown function [Kyrpidia spormannii]|uniref:Uncharacterized protein n=1 Tax=Kyrpidia spormannii TaxID=2055160 RepID=A0A6F9EHU3_9BACL|nr:protein of unknown function [Kyrpidia spormannii]
MRRRCEKMNEPPRRAAGRLNGRFDREDLEMTVYPREKLHVILKENPQFLRGVVCCRRLRGTGKNGGTFKRGLMHGIGLGHLSAAAGTSCRFFQSRGVYRIPQSHHGLLSRRPGDDRSSVHPCGTFLPGGHLSHPRAAPGPDRDF